MLARTIGCLILMRMKWLRPSWPLKFARRLQTVMERVLDELSFNAPDLDRQQVTIDAAYVQKHIGDLAKNTDLSRFIL